jgi:hypothetical protein
MRSLAMFVRARAPSLTRRVTNGETCVCEAARSSPGRSFGEERQVVDRFPPVSLLVATWARGWDGKTRGKCKRRFPRGAKSRQPGLSGYAA